LSKFPSNGTSQNRRVSRDNERNRSVTF
jgi:hypothetical protein